MSANTEHIAIIGAGLAGALMACYLGRAGYRVTVYERRADPRAHGFIGGRSINLALSERGLHALRQVGLAEHVLERAIPMPGRMIHARDGALHFQAYSDNPADHINSVSRADLNLILLEAAVAYPGVQLVFDHRCAEIDFRPPTITFERSAGVHVRIEADRIIGADGAFSAVRLQMMLASDRFDYSQAHLEHGYKELTIPPAGACGVEPAKFDGFAMNPNALHIWPRGGYMIIALPNHDRSFTCTCFWPFTGPNGFKRLRTDDEILRYFRAEFPDAVPLMPDLVEEYRRNPTSSLVTVRCQPWHIGDKAVLIGDAAHAIVPFYGQGMNAAFEDCEILAGLVERSGGDWASSFATFSRERKTDTDAIADMAIDNFIEMRDKTASPLFRARKKLEHALHHLLPDTFLPLYNMISFTTIPYALARRRSRQQTRTITAAVVAVVVLLVMLAALIVRAAIN